jgi:ferric-dicitrate binding protein FerR (iron transport regulator)
MPTERIWILITRKLSGEANQSELQELEELLRIDPESARIMAELYSYWQSPAEKDQDFLEATYLLHIDRLKKAGHDLNQGEETTTILFEPAPYRKRQYLKYTLLALPFLIAGIFYFSRSQSTKPLPVAALVKNEVQTRKGSKSQMTLPDGSQVWLNSDTKLTYETDFNGSNREVNLEGEAYFDVVKNADKPFIIHTRKMDIRVIGTAFNVRAYNSEEKAEATLLRGSIEVILKDRKNQKILLKPNEKISISTPSEPTNLKSADPSMIARTAIPQVEIREIEIIPELNTAEDVAWKENRLYFKDQSMEQISVMLERWFGKKVVVLDESLKTARFTGNFENESLEEVLTAMQLSSPFSFHVTGNTIELSK